ncbi:MAG: glycosyltransferase family 4 protein [Lachnospiraceae bacterium]|nr:glycosyltransferase family 4 protein [Lachnospiraceae bacterium]
MEKKEILIIMGRYLPGYKDGGPVRSIKNLTDRLGNEYCFRILTTDRDHGDKEPYEGILYGQWNQVGKAQVRYVQPGKITKKVILECAQEVSVIYVCGCFNDYARKVLTLKKSGKLTQPVTVAAMGLFAPGAFSIHHTRKKMYMNVLIRNKLLDEISWSASNEKEVEQIQSIVGEEAKCFIAEDLPRVLPLGKTKERKKESGECRIAIVARISPEKNITYAIEVLQNLKGNVVLDIYGSLGNRKYVEECKKRIKLLPQSVTCNLVGPCDSEKVIDVLLDYDVFLLPTLGENYGHAIYEAMAAGCVPVISDRTRWTNAIETNNAGAAISLEQPEEFTKVLQKYVTMDYQRFALLAARCVQYALKMPVDTALDQYRRIFEQA